MSAKGSVEATDTVWQTMFGTWFVCIDCRWWYTEGEAEASKGVCSWCAEKGWHRVLQAVEKDDGKFDGSGSKHLLGVLNCDLCKLSMPMSSWMCYLDPTTFDFVERPDQLFTEAVAGEFKRTFDDRKCIYACIFCKGKKDGVPYLTEKLNEDGSLSGKRVPNAEWYRLVWDPKGCLY